MKNEDGNEDFDGPESIKADVDPDSFPDHSMEVEASSEDPMKPLPLFSTNPKKPKKSRAFPPGKPRVTMSQLACEAIINSETKMLNLDQLKQAIMAKYSYYKPPPGLGTNSILFVWTFTVKDRCAKACFLTNTQ